MIISASCRTDIPAFYAPWFLNRLAAGYCMVENPYSGQPYRVGLARKEVDGFVFWTKNIAPFLDALAEVQRRGYPFVVQYTINSYPRQLESRVVEAESSVQHMHVLADTYGAKAAVWRYDTILFSSLTPPDYHRRSFAKLAKALEGTTDEVVISFAQIYKKTRVNLKAAAREHQFTWHDPHSEVKLALTRDLTDIAYAHGMQVTVCSQPQFITAGAREAHCIDSNRLSAVAGETINAAVKGNRPECACHLSRDIGAYDTCPHGCVYCYAVRNRELALSRYRRHDPESEYLFSDSIKRLQPVSTDTQLELPLE